MKKPFLIVTLVMWLIGYGEILRAQLPNQVIEDLRTIHRQITDLPCSNPQLVSNRAMNLFLSDKIGSYLTNYKNISFFKNYITLNAATGIFTLNHNLYQPKGKIRIPRTYSCRNDNSVRSFYVVGIKANVIDAFATAFTETTANNSLGITLKKSWIGKPVTKIKDCIDKNMMDTKRELIVISLENEIKKREEEFINSLSVIKQDSVPDSVFTKTKEELRQNFYARLQEEFSRTFAFLQCEELIETDHYKRISTHWTNLSIYLPIILQQFTVAESIGHSSKNNKAYPFELAVSHTRFWESKRSGRFFLAIEAGIYLNNAAEAHSLESISYNEYKNRGGIDSVLLGQRKINKIFIGNYQTFITPAAKLNFVYYPPDSHIGVSTTIEQNLGNYKALNFILGIPVVLINKSGAPAANFEFQIKYFDVSHEVFMNRNFNDNISIGLTVGVPFSKIIY